MERAREEDGGGGGGGVVAQYSLDVSEGCGGGGVVARYSLDVSEGCGGRHSLLLDEYERMAFEAQLNRAILRRCYSEPSPARFPVIVHPTGAPPSLLPPRGAEGDGGTAPWRFCRLHVVEAVFRWLEAVRPVLSWLRSAWERRRMERAAAAAPRGPPTTMPRVQLMDYLC